MDFLNSVDKYYHLKFVKETYCLKCNNIEKNFNCTQCNKNLELDNKIYNNYNYVRYLNNDFDSLLNKFLNLSKSLDELLFHITEFRTFLRDFKM